MSLPIPEVPVGLKLSPELSKLGRQLSASQSGIAAALSGVQLSGSLRNITEASKRISASGSGVPNALKMLDDASKHNAELAELLRAPLLSDRTRQDFLSDHVNKATAWRMPDLPPSPSIKTNDLLGSLNDRIDIMSELLAQQIEFENTQVALMRDLLSAALTGAEAQDTANRDALSIARRNMWIAIFAALVAIAGVVIAL